MAVERQVNFLTLKIQRLPVSHMHRARSVTNHVLEEEGDIGLVVQVVIEVEVEQFIGGDVQDLLIYRWHDGQMPITLNLQLLKLKPGTKKYDTSRQELIKEKAEFVGCLFPLIRYAGHQTYSYFHSKHVPIFDIL